MRIASLLPSATEIVCAIGAGPELAARSAECDYPSSVRSLPVLMRPSEGYPVNGDSAAIDRYVLGRRGRDQSLYTIDVELLRRLDPDLLLTQDLCGVCSVTAEEVAAACRAAGARPRIVSLTPRSVEDVWGNIETVGEAVGRSAEAKRLASSLRATATPRTVHALAPRVAVVEWLDPPILAGLWAPGMIARAGGIPLGPAEGATGVRTSWSALMGDRPDLVVIAPCSYRLDRTRAELRAREAARGFDPSRVRLGAWLADEAFFSRPGPRLADGIRLLDELLRGGSSSVPPSLLERWSEVAA